MSLWILYPGASGEYGGRAEAETADDALDLIIAEHVAGGADERTMRAALGLDRPEETNDVAERLLTRVGGI